jgi:hypothetical protein
MGKPPRHWEPARISTKYSEVRNNRDPRHVFERSPRPSPFCSYPPDAWGWNALKRMKTISLILTKPATPCSSFSSAGIQGNKLPGRAVGTIKRCPPYVPARPLVDKGLALRFGLPGWSVAPGRSGSGFPAGPSHPEDRGRASRLVRRTRKIEVEPPGYSVTPERSRSGSMAPHSSRLL